MKNKTIMISGRGKKELERILLKEEIGEVLEKPFKISLLNEALKRINKETLSVSY